MMLVHGALHIIISFSLYIPFGKKYVYFLNLEPGFHFLPVRF